MRKERLYHSLRLLMIHGARRHAEYLKKHNVLGGIGENCSWGPWHLPLYAKLIKLHDNVFVHKTALLIPHDMINRFLRRVNPEAKFNNTERIGCIEIMDNVYICANATILPDVRIGRNCLISVGSVVSQDVPDNSIVAGNPARVVGHMDSYIAWRQAFTGNDPKFRRQLLPDAIAEEQWNRFEQARSHKQDQRARDADITDG